MKDRQITPDFKEERVFTESEVDSLTDTLLVDLQDIVDEMIYSDYGELNPMDVSNLKTAVLTNLRKKL